MMEMFTFWKLKMTYCGNTALYVCFTVGSSYQSFLRTF